MRGTIIVILALLVIQASTASFSKTLPPVASIGFPKSIGQNNTLSEMKFNSPITGAGGFQVMPTDVIIGNVFHSPQTIRQSIWPLALMPPFQVMFRGPTIVNGYTEARIL